MTWPEAFACFGLCIFGSVAVWCITRMSAKKDEEHTKLVSEIMKQPGVTWTASIGEDEHEGR